MTHRIRRFIIRPTLYLDPEPGIAKLSLDSGCTVRWSRIRIEEVYFLDPDSSLLFFLSDLTTSDLLKIREIRCSEKI